MADTFSIDIPGIERLHRWLGSERFVRALERGIRGATHEAHISVHRRTPVRTGKLRNSVKSRVGPGLTGRVFTNLPYASYVEYGTRPHVITPRNRKVLRFEAGGRTVFARRVRHPGTKGAKMFAHTLSEDRDRIVGAMRRSIERWLEGG